jgi:hypothetical protein
VPETSTPVPEDPEIDNPALVEEPQEVDGHE